MTEDISSNKGSSSVHDCSNPFETTASSNLDDVLNRNNINGEIAGQSVFVNTCESASDKKSFHITSVTLQRNSTDGNADESADESRTEEFPDNIDMSTDVRAETPRHAEHVVRKEDVLYKVTSVGSAPIIPTSTQYGIAVVSNPNADHIDNVIKFAANDKNTDFVIRNDCLQNGFEKSSGITANLSAREFNAKNERFKVVKIESNEPFKRGRWVCMDFLDQSMDQIKKSAAITNDGRESDKGTNKVDLPLNGVANVDNMTANNDKCPKGVNESDKTAPLPQAVDSGNQMNGDISTSVSPNQTFNAPFVPPSNVTQSQAQSLTHIIIPQPSQPQVASGSYGHSQSLPQTDLQHVHQTSVPQQQQQQQPVHVVSSHQPPFHSNIQHPAGLIGSGVSNIQNIPLQQPHQPDVYNQNVQQQMPMQQQPAVIQQQQYQAMPQQASQPRIPAPTSQSQSVPAQSQQGQNPHCMPQIPMSQGNQQPANPPPSNEITQQAPLTQPQSSQPNIGQQYQQPQPSGQASLQHSIPQIPIQQQTFQQPAAPQQIMHQVPQQLPVQHQHNQVPVQSMPVSQQPPNVHPNSSQQGNVPQQTVISNVSSHMPSQPAVAQPPIQSSVSFLTQQQNTLQQTVIHQQPASQSSAQQVLPQPSQLIQSQIAPNSDHPIHMQAMHPQQQPQIIQQQSVPSQISQPPQQHQQPAPPQSIPSHQQQMQHIPQQSNAPPQQSQQQPQTVPQHSQQPQQTTQQLPQQMQPQQMQPQQMQTQPMQTQQMQPPVQQIQLQQQQQIQQQQQTQNGQQQIHHQQVLQQPVAQPQQQQQQQQQQQSQQQTHQLIQSTQSNLPHQSVQQPQSFQSSVQQTMAQSNQPPPQSQSNQPAMLPNVQPGIMTQCMPQTQQIANQQSLPQQQQQQQHQIQPKPGSMQQTSQAPMQPSQGMQHTMAQSVPTAQNIQQQPQSVQQQQPYQPVVTHQTAPTQMNDQSNIPVPTSQAGYQVDVMLPNMSQPDVIMASNQNQQFAMAQQQTSQNIAVQAQMPLHVSIQQPYQNAPPPNYVNASGLNLISSSGNTSIGNQQQQQQQTPPLSQQSYYSHAPMSQPMAQKTCTAQSSSSAAITSQDLQHLCAHPHQIMSSVAQPTLMTTVPVQGMQTVGSGTHQAGAGQNTNVNLTLQGQQQQVPYSMQSQCVYAQSSGAVMSSAQVSANAQTQTAGMMSVGVAVQQAPPQLQQPQYGVSSAPSAAFTTNVVHQAQLQQPLYNVPGSQMFGGASSQPAPAVPFAEMVGIDPQQLAYPSPQFTEQVCEMVRGTDEMANQQRPPEDVDSTAGNNNAVAIDNKIEQAMDLVKSHLMFAVREEVEVLKEKIAELMDRINQLEVENSILKANATPETIESLPKHASSTASSAPSLPSSSQSQAPTAPANGQPP